MNLFTKFFKQLTPEERKQKIRSDLIRRESEVARDIFGPTPEGGNRDFFCLDKSTWVWVESWIDSETGEKKEVTTRYLIRPTDVIKSQNGGAYVSLSDKELANFQQAIESYDKKMRNGIYKDYAKYVKPAKVDS